MELECHCTHKKLLPSTQRWNDINSEARQVWSRNAADHRLLNYWLFHRTYFISRGKQLHILKEVSNMEAEIPRFLPKLYIEKTEIGLWTHSKWGARLAWVSKNRTGMNRVPMFTCIQGGSQITQRNNPKGNTIPMVILYHGIYEYIDILRYRHTGVYSLNIQIY